MSPVLRWVDDQELAKYYMSGTLEVDADGGERDPADSPPLFA